MSEQQNNNYKLHLGIAVLISLQMIELLKYEIESFLQYTYNKSASQLLLELTDLAALPLCLKCLTVTNSCLCANCSIKTILRTRSCIKKTDRCQSGLRLEELLKQALVPPRPVSVLHIQGIDGLRKIAQNKYTSSYR